MKKVPTKKASKHAAPSFFLPLVGIEKAFNEHSPQPKRLGIRRSSAAVPQDTRAHYILLSSFFLSLPDIVRTRSLSPRIINQSPPLLFSSLSLPRRRFAPPALCIRRHCSILGWVDEYTRVCVCMHSDDALIKTRKLMLARERSSRGRLWEHARVRITKDGCRFFFFFGGSRWGSWWRCVY